MDLFDHLQQIIENIVKFDKWKSGKIKTEMSQGQREILSPSADDGPMYDPNKQPTNIGVYGLYDYVVTKEGKENLPTAMYDFLYQLRGRIDLVNARLSANAKLSHPGRRSKIHRFHKFIVDKSNPSSDWKPLNYWSEAFPVEMDRDEKISWESKLHQIFNGGCISRIYAQESDIESNLITIIENVLRSEIILFKLIPRS
jgi:hypothetical protein